MLCFLHSCVDIVADAGMFVDIFNFVFVLMSYFYV